MAPKRIQMSRQRPWRAENPDAVIVGRGTDFGNPFRVDGYYVIRDGRARPTLFPNLHSDAIHIPDAETAVKLYRGHVASEPELRALIRRVVGDRDVACWCKLDASCHGDVILEVAAGA